MGWSELIPVWEGTAEAADVREGYTFTNSSGAGLTGTMVNNGSVTRILTPKTTTQTYTIPEGYHDGTGMVTVRPAPTSLINGDATEANVLSGKTFFVDSYTAKTGTMTNRGAWTGSTTGSGNVTIPEGYHDGSGYVSGKGAYDAGVASVESKLRFNKDAGFIQVIDTDGNWVNIYATDSIPIASLGYIYNQGIAAVTLDTTGYSRGTNWVGKASALKTSYIELSVPTTMQHCTVSTSKVFDFTKYSTLYATITWDGVDKTMKLDVSSVSSAYILIALENAHTDNKQYNLFLAAVSNKTNWFSYNYGYAQEWTQTGDSTWNTARVKNIWVE